MILTIDYRLLQHPDSKYSELKYERWSYIKVCVLDKERNIVKIVFEIEWDILVLLNWLIENKQKILSEDFPINRNDLTVAGAIYYFYEDPNFDVENEKLIDLIYNYRTHHGLRFALRGVNIDDVYIGKQGSEIVISFYDDSNNWDYKIEVDEFFKSVYRIQEDLASSV